MEHPEKKRLEDDYRIAMTNPAVYACLNLWRNNPMELTFQDALIAMVCILSEQNTMLSERNQRLEESTASPPIFRI